MLIKLIKNINNNNNNIIIINKININIKNNNKKY